MGDLVEYLYSHFLLRDLLAKVIPGFLLLLMLASLIPGMGPAVRLMHGLPEIVLIPSLYALSFLFGMVIQFIGSFTGILLIHVWPATVAATREEVSLSQAKLFLERNSANRALLRARERYVVLKEMTANFASLSCVVALIFASRFITHTSRFGGPPFFLPIALAVLALALARQNRLHAREQWYWEGGSGPYRPLGAQAEGPAPSQGRKRRARGS